MVHARWELHPADGGPIIYGDLRAPEGGTPRSVVVICHGFKGFKDWGFFPPLGRAIARRGHAAVSFNFSRSGVGADGVDFSALELFAGTTHSRNVEEIKMVIDALYGGNLFPRPPEKLGLFGHSRGGGEAILAAASDPRVDSLVTWSAISDVRRWTDEQVEQWQRGETVHIPNARTGQQMPVGPAYWEDVTRNAESLDIQRAAATLRIPWLIVHGDADETVSIEDARVLERAAGENAALRAVVGAGHTFGAAHPYAGATAELREATAATLDWFAQTIADPL